MSDIFESKIDLCNISTLNLYFNTNLIMNQSFNLHDF